MSRPKLEVAGVFRRHGAAWRAANKAHLSLAQRRVMTAIEVCRTAALGGHVERCEDCAHTRIAYNSCRNRHCPKCQWPAAQAWMAAREAELLPVPYFHVVFTLPAALGAIAYQNKAKLYGLLFTAAAETLTTIAGDPKHLGADIGVTAVLHTWGQNLQHHPHLHCIVPGGGLSPDGERWIACQNGFFLPVRVLSRLFRRLFLQGLEAMHAADELQFFADLGKLEHANAWRAYLAPLRKSDMPKNPSPVLSRSWPISRDGHDHALPRVVPCGFDPTQSPMKPRSLQNVQFAVVPPCTPSPRLEKKRARRGRHLPPPRGPRRARESPAAGLEKRRKKRWPGGQRARQVARELERGFGSEITPMRREAVERRPCSPPSPRTWLPAGSWAAGVARRGAAPRGRCPAGCRWRHGLAPGKSSEV